MLTRVVEHYGRWKNAAWASGGLILETDETTIQPSQGPRHEALKHEAGYRLRPRRARQVFDASPDCTNLLGPGAFLCVLPGRSLMLAV